MRNDQILATLKANNPEGNQDATEIKQFLATIPHREVNTADLSNDDLFNIGFYTETEEMTGAPDSDRGAQISNVTTPDTAGLVRYIDYEGLSDADYRELISHLVGIQIDYEDTIAEISDAHEKASYEFHDQLIDSLNSGYKANLNEMTAHLGQ